MTFEEWWKYNGWRIGDKQEANELWDSAAAEEREACAKVCEEEICACCWEDDALAAAEHLADTIRKRSNA